MYEHKPYDWRREMRLEECHLANWKSTRKRDRPLCGARCRDGHSCQAKAICDKRTNKPKNGRCRMHGGLSTGARTHEGKERCREAARRGMLAYWAKRKTDSPLTFAVQPVPAQSSKTR